MSQLPKNLEIYRVNKWHIGREFKNKKNCNKQKELIDDNNRHISFVKKGVAWLIRRVFIYDFTWLLEALKIAIKLIRKNDIQLIFSSYPNSEAHILALILSSLFKIKWVCEFRDPWNMYQQQLYNYPYILNKMNKYFEKKCLIKCHKIIVVEEYHKKYLMGKMNQVNKYELIYNGYDPDDFNNIIGDNNFECFTISYIGTFGHYRTTAFFLTAMGNLLIRYSELKNKIKVLLIGESRFSPGFDEKIIEMIKNNRLIGVVERVSFLPHKEALSYMMQSDVLLLIEGSIPGENMDRSDVVTAKIFEYLFSKKPILALVPPNGSAAKVRWLCAWQRFHQDPVFFPDLTLLRALTEVVK